MFSSERNEVRKIIFEAWRKHLAKIPVEALESQIIDVVLLHPEYHDFLTHPEQYQDHDFPEANPFLHLGLHLSIREQITTNRPQGIRGIYQTLSHKLGDQHLAEHKMIDCLAEVLWTAQRTGVAPDQAYYLEQLKQL